MTSNSNSREKDLTKLQKSNDYVVRPHSPIYITSYSQVPQKTNFRWTWLAFAILASASILFCGYNYFLPQNFRRRIVPSNLPLNPLDFIPPPRFVSSSGARHYAQHMEYFSPEEELFQFSYDAVVPAGVLSFEELQTQHPDISFAITHCSDAEVAIQLVIRKGAPSHGQHLMRWAQGVFGAAEFLTIGPAHGCSASGGTAPLYARVVDIQIATARSGVAEAVGVAVRVSLAGATLSDVMPTARLNYQPVDGTSGATMTALPLGFRRVHYGEGAYIVRTRIPEALMPGDADAVLLQAHDGVASYGRASDVAVKGPERASKRVPEVEVAALGVTPRAVGVLSAQATPPLIAVVDPSAGPAGSAGSNDDASSAGGDTDSQGAESEAAQTTEAAEVTAEGVVVAPEPTLAVPAAARKEAMAGEAPEEAAITPGADTPRTDIVPVTGDKAVESEALLVMTDPCTSHRDCGACAAQSQCGWCAHSASCVSAADEDAAAGMCDGVLFTANHVCPVGDSVLVDAWTDGQVFVSGHNDIVTVPVVRLWTPSASARVVAHIYQLRNSLSSASATRCSPAEYLAHADCYLASEAGRAPDPLLYSSSPLPLAATHAFNLTTLGIAQAAGAALLYFVFAWPDGSISHSRTFLHPPREEGQWLVLDAPAAPAADLRKPIALPVAFSDAMRGQEIQLTLLRDDSFGTDESIGDPVPHTLPSKGNTAVLHVLLGSYATDVEGLRSTLPYYLSAAFACTPLWCSHAHSAPFRALPPLTAAVTANYDPVSGRALRRLAFDEGSAAAATRDCKGKRAESLACALDRVGAQYNASVSCDNCFVNAWARLRGLEADLSLGGVALLRANFDGSVTGAVEAHVDIQLAYNHTATYALALQAQMYTHSASLRVGAVPMGMQVLLDADLHLGVNATAEAEGTLAASLNLPSFTLVAQYGYRLGKKEARVILSTNETSSTATAVSQLAASGDLAVTATLAPTLTAQVYHVLQAAATLPMRTRLDASARTPPFPAVVSAAEDGYPVDALRHSPPGGCAREHHMQYWLAAGLGRANASAAVELDRVIKYRRHLGSVSYDAGAQELVLAGCLGAVDAEDDEHTLLVYSWSAADTAGEATLLHWRIRAARWARVPLARLRVHFHVHRPGDRDQDDDDDEGDNDKDHSDHDGHDDDHHHHGHDDAHHHGNKRVVSPTRRCAGHGSAVVAPATALNSLPAMAITVLPRTSGDEPHAAAVVRSLAAAAQVGELVENPVQLTWRAAPWSACLCDGGDWGQQSRMVWCEAAGQDGAGTITAPNSMCAGATAEERPPAAEACKCDGGAGSSVHVYVLVAVGAAVLLAAAVVAVVCMRRRARTAKSSLAGIAADAPDPAAAAALATSATPKTSLGTTAGVHTQPDPLSPPSSAATAQAGAAYTQALPPSPPAYASAYTPTMPSPTPPTMPSLLTPLPGAARSPWRPYSPWRPLTGAPSTLTAPSNTPPVATSVPEAPFSPIPHDATRVRLPPPLPTVSAPAVGDALVADIKAAPTGSLSVSPPAGLPPPVPARHTPALCDDGELAAGRSTATRAHVADATSSPPPVSHGTEVIFTPTHAPAATNTSQM